jgi:hypothetical protein
MRHSFIRSHIQLGDGAPSNIVFKLAETRDELEQAFQVLHDAYVGQGYMDPHPSGMRVTKYHALPTTAVLVAKDLDTGLVVATVSIVRNTALGLPLDSIFPMEELKSKYRHLAEVSSLAIRKDYRREPSQLLWPLLRYFYKYIKDVMRVDAYVIGVNPSWHDLYKGILSFTKLDGFEASTYGFVNNAPVSAYVVNVEEQELLFYKNYAHLPTQANFYGYYKKLKLSDPQYLFPKRRYHSVQNTVMTRDLLEYFFVEKTDALELFTEKERSIIQQYYPKKGYSKLIVGNDWSSVENLRKTNRFITRFSAKMKQGDNYENDIEVTILDFSMDGLKLECSIDLPDRVELRLGIGPYDSSYIVAQVRRRYGKHYGLEILSYDRAWDEFMEAMQSQFHVMASYGDELAERRRAA